MPFGDKSVVRDDSPTAEPQSQETGMDVSNNIRSQSTTNVRNHPTNDGTTAPTVAVGNLRRTWPQSAFRRHSAGSSTLPVTVEPHTPVEETELPDYQTRAVSRMRLVFLAVLLASMASTATGVYVYLSSSEIRSFKQSFTDDSNKLIEVVGETLFTTLGAVDNYIVSVMSMKRSTNQTWPWVTVPDSAIRLAKLRSLSKAVFVQQAHFVTLEQRSAWENYTTTHNQWVRDSLVIQEEDKNYHGATYTEAEYYDVIFGHRGASPLAQAQLLPTWHASPFVPEISRYNFDYFSSNKVTELLPEVVEQKHVVIGKIANLASEENAEGNAIFNNYMRDFIQNDDDPSEPFTLILFPMVEESADHVSLTDEMPGGYTAGNRTVVGLFTMYIYYRDLIRNVLPNDSKGITVVFENSCNESFTYRIDGSNATYLGPGDKHDPKFNDMGVPVRVSDLDSVSSMGRQYTGLPLRGEQCPYTLHVYPSEATREQFTSPNPVIFTLVAVLIFIFTCIIFWIYDVCVERRQRRAVFAVTRSSANIELLEKMVAERTQKLEEANARLELANQRVTRASAAQLEHFACMSHEIRTPLNCILGLSSLLLDTELSPAQEESMRMIVSSGDLLLTVVNDVLDYSKLETGNVEINPVRSNLQETLNVVIQSMESKAQQKKLAIRTVYNSSIGEFLQVDYRRLQQILYNLLGNAVKFSDGTIDLSVSLLLGTGASRALSDTKSDANRDESEEVVRTETMVVYESGVDFVGSERGSANSVRSSTRRSFQLKSLGPVTSDALEFGNMIRFTIKDYGKGIEKGDFETIFQPFRQASAETERVYGGTGLGLAVTSKLVASMGGSISVDSVVGEWSEFTVDLPFHDYVVDIEGMTHRLKEASILLIDDDQYNVREVSRIFCECALDFTCHKTMDDAIAMVQRNGSVSPSRTYVCLMQEQLYDADKYQVLANAAKFVLLSHGPKYAVKDSIGHYRSLTHVLPSVLVDSLASYVESSCVEAQVEQYMSCSKYTEGNAAENARILVAEDNQINQKVMTKVLERLNVRNVDVVNDGRKACDKVLQQTYDIVLMDIQMPVMSGIEACQEITSIRKDHLHSPRIVFVTAHVSDFLETACRAAGGIDFLSKPINVSDLHDCILRHTSTQPDTSRESGNDGLRILVAGDTSSVDRHVLLRVLARLQCKNVAVCSDGKQACERERSEIYDVIIMDVQMPIMSGIDCCQAIMSRQGGHPLPKIIILSKSEKEESECTAAGGFAFVTTPVTMSKIENTLYQVALAAKGVERVEMSANFESHLPLPHSASEVKTKAVAPMHEEKKLRILIAEDNKINQKVLLRILERLGHTDVDVVDNGKLACEKEEENVYDVILMDLQMPVMNGVDACKEIMQRSTTGHPRPNVVFLTAHAADAYETESRAAGATDFLTKPINITSLENCLRRVMQD